jgi:hypothetical protein
MLTWSGSIIVQDIKPENWSLTAGLGAEFSRCVDRHSARFNPLIEVRKGALEMWDVHNMANIQIDPEGARAWGDHWEKTAHALLTSAILHVFDAEPEKTLARIVIFLGDPSCSIQRTLRIMPISNYIGTDQVPQAHLIVATVARELLSTSDNERSGVVSTAMSFLGLNRNPPIAVGTAHSDCRISELLQADPQNYRAKLTAHAEERFRQKLQKRPLPTDLAELRTELRAMRQALGLPTMEPQSHLPQRTAVESILWSPERPGPVDLRELSHARSRADRLPCAIAQSRYATARRGGRLRRCQ